MRRIPPLRPPRHASLRPASVRLHRATAGPLCRGRSTATCCGEWADQLAEGLGPAYGANFRRSSVPFGQLLRRRDPRVALGPARSHDARGADPRDGVHAGLRRGLVRHERQALGTASGQHGRRDPGGTAAAAVVVDDRVAVGGARPDLRVAVARHSPPEDHAAVALRSALPDDDDLAGPRGALPRERHARVVDPRLDPEDVRRPAACKLCRTLGGRSAARVELLDGPVVRTDVFDGSVACGLALGDRVFGASASPPSVTPTGAESLPPSNVPETAPTTKMSTASTSIRRQRRRGAGAADSIATGGGSGGATGAGSTTTAGGGGGAAGLGRSTTSGSSLRACSASTGSTSTSSGLIGPRCPEPRSGPASIRTVLQVRRRADGGERPNRKSRCLQAIWLQRCALEEESAARCCKRPPNAQSARGQLVDGVTGPGQTDPPPGLAGTEGHA